ncbi:MAG: hypothetical protein JWM11_1439 [Planctomycetaceae bacterium]|nr:hypothetical protein [Planctomycetaceae bacterium]
MRRLIAGINIEKDSFVAANSIKILSAGRCWQGPMRIGTRIRLRLRLPNFARGAVLGFVFLSLTATGCYESGERHFPGQVRGTVTCAGAGLESASISFEGGAAGAFGGPVHGGKYQLENVAEGNYDVVIYPVNTSTPELDPNAPPYDPLSRTDIPPHYRSALTSGLKATITSGSNTFDFQLDAEPQ